MPLMRRRGEALLVAVRVQPRASRERIMGLQGDALKVALTAPPVEGAANEALCSLLAKSFGVAKSRVRIEQGESSRDKVVCIDKPSAEAVISFCQMWKLPESDY